MAFKISNSQSRVMPTILIVLLILLSLIELTNAEIPKGGKHVYVDMEVSQDSDTQSFLTLFSSGVDK